MIDTIKPEISKILSVAIWKYNFVGTRVSEIIQSYTPINIHAEYQKYLKTHLAKTEFRNHSLSLSAPHHSLAHSKGNASPIPPTSHLCYLEREREREMESGDNWGVGKVGGGKREGKGWAWRIQIKLSNIETSLIIINPNKTEFYKVFSSNYVKGITTL